MKLDAHGLNTIANFEGFRADAYKVPGANERYWTIGYGHYGPDVRPGQKISHTAALILLRHDAASREAAVNKLVKVPLSQAQFNALVSFVFNLGAGALAESTLLKKLNAKDYAGAQREFGKWNKAGGHAMEGLTRRRKVEAAMFGDRAPGPPPIRFTSTERYHLGVLKDKSASRARRLRARAWLLTDAASIQRRARKRGSGGWNSHDRHRRFEHIRKRALSFK